MQGKKKKKREEEEEKGKWRVIEYTLQTRDTTYNATFSCYSAFYSLFQSLK